MKRKEAAIKSTLIVISVLVMPSEVTTLISDTHHSIHSEANHNRLISPAQLDGCFYTDSYLNRRHLKIRSDDIIYGTGPSSRSGEEERFKHQCLQPRLVVRRYEKEDVVRCLDSLWVRKGSRQPVYIAFVGDSTSRQHFVSLVRLIPDYDRETVSRFNTPTAEQLYHDDMNITSPLLANLKLAFFWRNLINEEMLSLFRRWASTEDQSQVPDLIFFGATVHHMLPSNHFSFETYQTLLENELVPLMKKSLAVHPHQEIIWLKPSHTIERNVNSVIPVYQDKIKKYTAILPRALKDTRIVIWDTINALAEEYIRACTLTRYDRQDVHYFENCHDLIHTGMRAISIGTRLLLNHLCKTL
ncbi:uncharacterized protein LOC124198610 [Daphnia pulex]|uniref:uncharacterized protein LOC124198610 n=1 Tax=Daphnia pulex TaxID=6669 RepID=UPI001EDF24A7|nr:uncharacterized protein LOC124198610 [Daphnia pulex]